MGSNDIFGVDGVSLIGGLPEVLEGILIAPLEESGLAVGVRNSQLVGFSKNQFSIELNDLDLLNFEQNQTKKQQTFDPFSSQLAAPIINFDSGSAPVKVSQSSVDPITGSANHQAFVNSDESDALVHNQSFRSSEDTEESSSEVSFTVDSIEKNSAEVSLAIDNIEESSTKTPFTIEDIEENSTQTPFTIEDIELNESFSSLYDEEWLSLGKFGDFDAQNDAQLNIEDTEGKIVETFSLTGNGYGEVFKDDEYHYIFFSDIDETTAVEVSALNNIRFDDFVGTSLQIETEGGITAGDIVILNPDSSDSPGLTLRSGLGEVETSTSSSSYEITNLGVFPGDENSYAYSINNSGQVVGGSAGFREGFSAFLYDDGQIIDLNTFTGDNYTRASDINDSGQIVGWSGGATEVGRRAFLYDDGQITNLGTLPGGRTSYAYSINNSGQVVGGAGVPYYNTSRVQTFFYNDGQMTHLGTLPNSDTSYAFAINNSGQIVGRSSGVFDGVYEDRAFLYSDGQMTNLGTLPGAKDSLAYDINDSGQIAGESGGRAFLYSDGQMTNLGTLTGGGYSFARGINRSGQVVGGSSKDKSYTNSAFLYSDGQMLDLNNFIPEDSGWILHTATAINDKGQIVGGGYYEGKNRAFLLDPTSTLTPSITVGNISTLGDSVLLESSEITFMGSSISTTGGLITIDGSTIIDTSTGTLTINSTNPSDQESGGNITFTDTLDAESTGTQTLKVKAGQGNVTFNKAIGSEAALSEFTVASAKTLSTQDIFTEGDIIVKVIDNVSTADLSTNSLGKVSISLGKIEDELYKSKGDVSLGKISSTELDILSNGSVTIQGTVETEEGNIKIIALKDIFVDKMIAQQGGISLISGTGGITATETIKSDEGLIALAKENITTGEIESTEDVVILKSHQGAIAVNGTIATEGDVSLAAPGDVVAGEITSRDGAVALMSAGGTVTAQGVINSVEDVTLGAVGDIEAQRIASQFGAVALVSTEGSVRGNGSIFGGFGVEVSAQQNASVGNISSFAGTVFLNSEQGTVAGGSVVTEGDDIYISSANNLVLDNIISDGGAIALVSSQGSVTTGYLRSDDSNNSGGKIYLQAARTIKVLGSVYIDNTDDGVDNGTDYSIYTGVEEKGWISLVRDGESEVAQEGKKAKKVKKFKKSDLLIADVGVVEDATLSGTVAEVSGGKELISLTPSPPKPTPQNIPKPTPQNIPKPTPRNNLLIILEIFKRILDAGGTAPAHVAEINPITGEPYSNIAEFELVNDFSPNQRDEIIKYVNISTYRLTFEHIQEKGKFDSKGNKCYGIPLLLHLGGNDYHNQYATDVTGSNGDFLVIPAQQIARFASAFYDGIVLSGSKATRLQAPQISQKVGDLAEVKTGHDFLNRILQGTPLPERTNKNGETIQSDQNRYNQLVNQVLKEALIAQACQKPYFISFDSRSAANSANQLLNSDARILAAGLSIKVNFILSRPLSRAKQ